MDFAHTLRQIRRTQGHEKARSFHSELVERGVECNYAYYMKLEAGQVLPSSKLVEQISETLGEAEASSLILSYCRSMFPNSKHLFPAIQSATPQTDEDKESESQAQTTGSGQGRELSRRQVGVLARSKSHYHLFLIATLARRDLKMEELRQIFNSRILQTAIDDLELSKILRVTGENVKTYITEHKFPSAQDFPDLKPIYRQFDEWDESFAEDFEFNSIVDKMMVRRISPRYLGVIEKSLDTILHLVRASDELDDKHNEELIQIRLSLKAGRLPG